MQELGVMPDKEFEVSLWKYPGMKADMVLAQVMDDYLASVAK